MLQKFRKKTPSLTEDILISGEHIPYIKQNFSKKKIQKSFINKDNLQFYKNINDQQNQRKIFCHTSASSKQEIQKNYLNEVNQELIKQFRDLKDKSIKKKITFNQQKKLQMRNSQIVKKNKKQYNQILSFLPEVSQSNFSSVKKLPKISQKIKSNSTLNSIHDSFSKIQFKNSQKNIRSNSLQKRLFTNIQQKQVSQFRNNPTCLTEQLQSKLEQKSTKKQRLKSYSNYSSNTKPSKKQILASLKQIKATQILKKQKNQKLKIIRNQFQCLINQTNLIKIKNQNTFFKAYIQKGNNGVLVKQILKKRWWWHIVDEKPKVCMISQISAGLIKMKQQKKVQLYWTQWMDKSFINSLQPQQDDLYFKTIYDQYQFTQPQQQTKFDSVKKITDSQTFDKIKNKISLRKVNYFKNLFPKPEQKQSSSKIIQINQQIKQVTNPQEMKIHNHISGGLELHSKKLLFKNLSAYLKKKNVDPFQYLPLTFYIEDIDSERYESFIKKFDQFEKDKGNGEQNIWILKPGQNSNRGYGITVHKYKQQIYNELVKRLSRNNLSTQNMHKRQKRSVIVQKYLQKCFLINKRKFDIRCYMLITTVNGFLKGYWYQNGYIRTSSQQYNLQDTSNPMIHLTNQAIQCKNNSYGKYQDYNKLDMDSFIKYLTKMKVSINKFEDSFRIMKLIAYYLIASVSTKIKRYQYTFELFGLDFMLDDNLKPYLIEANSNPCLDTKGPVLTKIIRELVQNVFITAIDPLFPPPCNFQQKKQKKQEQINKDYFQSNKFQLIFSEKLPN